MWYLNWPPGTAFYSLLPSGRIIRKVTWDVLTRKCIWKESGWEKLVWYTLILRTFSKGVTILAYCSKTMKSLPAPNTSFMEYTSSHNLLLQYFSCINTEGACHAMPSIYSLLLSPKTGLPSHISFPGGLFILSPWFSLAAYQLILLSLTSRNVTSLRHFCTWLFKL